MKTISAKKEKSVKAKKFAKKIDKLKARIKKRQIAVERKRGLIYLGHIPHGFYEDEMLSYFRQFGVVTRVELCRSSRTGNSKGYGYVEFKNKSVARIAAETMNNYLFFKKCLISSYVPYSKRPKRLFRRHYTRINNPLIDRRGKLKHARNRLLDEKTAMAKQKKTLTKLAAKEEKLKKLNIFCNIKPAGVKDEETIDTTYVELDSDVDIRVFK